MPVLDLAGAGLSLLAILAFVLLLRDWWHRRGRFRPLELGTLCISGRTVALAWLLLLFLSFVAGVRGAFVLKVEASTRAAAPATADPFTGAQDPRVAVQQASTLEAPLPFYRWSRTEVRMEGTLQATTTTRTFQVPVWFIVGAVLYLQFVVRGRAAAHEQTGMV